MLLVDNGWSSSLAGVILLAICLFVLPAVLDPFRLNLLGKFLCYALVALGLDLLWGYAGKLSLGQGVFFGLGAYLFGMYLKLESSGGKLPDFMSWSGLTHAARLLAAVRESGCCAGRGGRHPGRCGRQPGLFVEPQRIGGVYFAIITQALAFIATTLFIGQQPFTGGTNGLTNFSHDSSARRSRTRTVQVHLYPGHGGGAGGLSGLALWLAQSRFGRLLVAHARRRTAGALLRLRPDVLRAAVFGVSAGLAGWAVRCSCRRSASSIRTRWASSWAFRW